MFNFLAKKLIQHKLKNVPQEQQEMIMAMVEKNPALFTKIAEEIQEKMKNGKDQMAATMEVMQAHQAELMALQSEMKK